MLRRLVLPMLAVASASPAIASATVQPTVWPYVQAATPTSIVIKWETPRACRPAIQLWDSEGHTLDRIVGSVGRSHRIHLKHLEPGTRYRYGAEQDGHLVAWGKFHTNLPPNRTYFRFAVLGDTGSGNANQFAVARQLQHWRPDFVIHTGDVIYNSGAARDYGPNFVKPYQDLITNTVIYPTLGNHDYVSNQGQPYLDFFSLPPNHPRGNERYYTFNYGDAQFFGLDSNAIDPAHHPETAWLEQQLRRSKARWRFAFFHHPLYSSGLHGSTVGLRQAWAPLFERYGVNVVFSGHDHHYERVKPQLTTAKPGFKPVTYMVSGGGGAWLRPIFPHTFTASARLAYHFVGVTMDGDRLSAEAIDGAGHVIDHFTLKRPGVTKFNSGLWDRPFIGPPWHKR